MTELHTLHAFIIEQIGVNHPAMVHIETMIKFFWDGLFGLDIAESYMNEGSGKGRRVRELRRRNRLHCFRALARSGLGTVVFIRYELGLGIKNLQQLNETGLAINCLEHCAKKLIQWIAARDKEIKMVISARGRDSKTGHSKPGLLRVIWETLDMPTNSKRIFEGISFAEPRYDMKKIEVAFFAARARVRGQDEKGIHRTFDDAFSEKERFWDDNTEYFLWVYNRQNYLLHPCFTSLGEIKTT